MGIKKLNHYLLETCSHEAIGRVPLNQFKGKRFAIDTSIYLYKFLSDDALLESFYQMLSVFRQYQIIPIFVFDGKPPVEKHSILWERYYKRKDAENKYNALIESILQQDIPESEQQAQIDQLSSMKRQFVRVTETHIQQVKQLLINLRIEFVDASSEADCLCAYLVKSGYAYGCISDDMDMFAYDCPNVIRKLNLIHHNCMLYNVSKIKQELNISDIQRVVILCGTDYASEVSWDIQTAIERFQFYKQEKHRKQTQSEFYTWLYERCFLNESQWSSLQSVYSMFCISNDSQGIPQSFDSFPEQDWTTLQPILETQGFVFCEAHC